MLHHVVDDIAVHAVLVVGELLAVSLVVGCAGGCRRVGLSGCDEGGKSYYRSGYNGFEVHIRFRFCSFSYAKVIL